VVRFNAAQCGEYNMIVQCWVAAVAIQTVGAVQFSEYVIYRTAQCYQQQLQPFKGSVRYG
jgi:hypothetical protein